MAKVININPELNNLPKKTKAIDDLREYSDIDLLKHIDSSHILHKMSTEISAFTPIYPSTIFLAGLTIFSAFACRAYSATYENGAVLPIGLFSIIEQPSNTCKSEILNWFKRPFVNARKDIKATIKQKIDDAERAITQLENDGAEVKGTPELQAFKEAKALIDKLNKYSMFPTDSTPEALAASMIATGGYFSLVSSEKGLFKTVMGGHHSDGKSNNDILLQGFNGEWVEILRKSGNGENFAGYSVGGICMFTQIGSIAELYSVDDDCSGLAARFSKLSEKNKLGNTSYFDVFRPKIDHFSEYNDVCADITLSILQSSNLNNPSNFLDLSKLSLSRHGYKLIREMQKSNAAHFGKGGKYADEKIAPYVGKLDMQVIKQASSLHLLDGGLYVNEIPDKYIESCIAINADMLAHNMEFLSISNEIGDNAAYHKILEFVGSDLKTHRDIARSCSRRSPFRGFTDGYQKVMASIETMLELNLLSEQVDVNTGRVQLFVKK
ncbi:Protein of unknown function DUF3987) [uncultured Caudovirales phage]|uniref:DUF3987 domain-containing protein n=1 Tax=uncultured Caudovirales phage TaxID=2100421 RepID=A0A6J5LGC1_9CAUD|nr:Protein of unknown function DUF3987) [uncultured Caudovirales phage]